MKHAIEPDAPSQPIGELPFPFPVQVLLIDGSSMTTSPADVDIRIES
jgi:hypothetical protein